MRFFPPSLRCEVYTSRSNKSCPLLLVSAGDEISPPPTTDAVDSSVLSELSADAADYEAESWSLAVEHKFCKKQDKRAVKRQDVIYGERAVTFRDATRVSWEVP